MTPLSYSLDRKSLELTRSMLSYELPQFVCSVDAVNGREQSGLRWLQVVGQPRIRGHSAPLFTCNSFTKMESVMGWTVK